MLSCTTRRSTFGAVVLSILLVQGVSPACADSGADSSVHLKQLTLRYLQDRADRVTEKPTVLGKAGSVLTAAPATAAFHERTSAELGELDRLRRVIRGTPSELSGADVVLEDYRYEIRGRVATVRLAEATDFYYAHSSDAPMTSYRVDHVLQFERDTTGAWVLSSDALDVPADAMDPIPYVHATKLRKADVVPAKSPKIPSSLKPWHPSLEPAAAGTQPARPSPAESRPYHRLWAATYATSYGKSRNPKYRNYPNDCANFVSQALREGGWEDILGVEFDKNVWWEHNTVAGVPVNSNTWSVSHDQMYFGYAYSDRLRNYVGENVGLADLVYADWEGKPDGHIDHAMMITSGAGSQDWRVVKVTYHTVDQVNITMDLVTQKAGPGKDYYFFSLNHAV